MSSSPTVGADGSIYFTDNEGHVISVDSEGSLNWKSSTEFASPLSSITIGGDGTLYFSAGGELYAYEPNGVQKWAYTPADASYTDIIVGEGGTLYVGAGNGDLYAIK
jgi:large repetitive protein